MLDYIHSVCMGFVFLLNLLVMHWLTAMLERHGKAKSMNIFGSIKSTRDTEQKDRLWRKFTFMYSFPWLNKSDAFIYAGFNGKSDD